MSGYIISELALRSAESLSKSTSSILLIINYLTLLSVELNIYILNFNERATEVKMGFQASTDGAAAVVALTNRMPQYIANLCGRRQPQ